VGIKMTKILDLPNDLFEKFSDAVINSDPVTGLTHNFYRYPARFSPEFAKQAILAFSKPDDLVLDPFMGGGTTLVEALANGRNAVGIDLSPLANFVANVKTTPIGQRSLDKILSWAENVVKTTKSDKIEETSFWSESGYQKDVPWTLRRVIELILAHIPDLPRVDQRRFAQCVLLKTAQWAIDCKEKVPPVERFRKKFIEFTYESIDGMNELVASVNDKELFCLCVNNSSVGLERYSQIKSLKKKPRLILTSPPYPGVHIIYHQWQVQSRKRTSAPFWIIGEPNGHTSSHYTFGDYRQQQHKKYFEVALQAFSSIRKIVDESTTVVQLIGFSDPTRQLPKYLDIMNSAGFKEVALEHNNAGKIKRLWRNIPNRKWYVDINGKNQTKEVVLVHKPD
jgi:DNA modification methylase